MKKIFYFVLIALLACVYACGDASKGSDSTKKSYASFDELEVNATYDELVHELLNKCDFDSLEYEEITTTSRGKELVYGLLSGKVNGELVYFTFLPDDEGTLRYKEYITTDMLDPKEVSNTVYNALGEGMTVCEYQAKKKAEKEKEAAEKEKRAAEQAEFKAEYNAISEADYPKTLDPFVTPDLKFCRVRGHVKEIRVNDEVIARFDKKGNLVKYPFQGDENPTFKRNAQGQIVEIEYAYESSSGVKGKDSFFYKHDKNGYLSDRISADFGNVHFVNDADGLARSIVFWDGSEAFYRYPKFDGHGNYTECVSCEKGHDEWYTKEERTIIYY